MRNCPFVTIFNSSFGFGFSRAVTLLVAYLPNGWRHLCRRIPVDANEYDNHDDDSDTANNESLSAAPPWVPPLPPGGSRLPPVAVNFPPNHVASYSWNFVTAMTRIHPIHVYHVFLFFVSFLLLLFGNFGNSLRQSR